MKTTFLKYKRNSIILIFYGFIITFFLTTSCKKEKPQKVLFDEYGLPAITGNGGHYFGYLLNGKPMYTLREDLSLKLGSIKATYWENTGRLEFSGGYHKGNDDYHLVISIQSGLEIGKVYPLKDYENVENHSAILDKTIPDDVFERTVIMYTSYNEEPGHIKIEHWDKEKEIISASFEIKVKERWRTEVMEIKKGRFDVKYRTKK